MALLQMNPRSAALRPTTWTISLLRWAPLPSSSIFCMKTIKDEKAVQLQSTFKLRQWNTPLRHRKTPSLPQLFTDKSRLVHFPISDCTTIHLSLFCIFRVFPAFLFKCRAALTTTFMVLSGVPGLFQNVFFPFYLYVCVCVCVCEHVSAFINDSARLFQTDATAIRWWKWFMETGQQITVTSQIHRSSCYYSHPLSLHSV